MLLRGSVERDVPPVLAPMQLPIIDAESGAAVPQALTGTFFHHLHPVASLKPVEGYDQVVEITLNKSADSVSAARAALLCEIQRLYLGVSFDWRAVIGASSAARVPLPGYPFGRVRYWQRSPHSLIPS